ncbi:unnamed protein product [Linum trigynum]|uniref:Reverse transcriptase zinc-binding domain-containing protein n=1 Tax=Linum trigynum TaxID=586398 RepID=A0AAV2F4X1_9ROSI
MIVAKFPNQQSEWFSGRSSGSLGGSLWARIVKLQPDFWKLTRIEHSQGFWTSFWFDTWIEGIRLAEEFARVVAAAESPNSTVAEYLSFSEGNCQWDIPLTHSLWGGAERERVRLFETLNSIPYQNFFAGPERPRWLPSPTAGFSVHSAYDHLAAERYLGISEFPSKVIWLSIIPSKICIFLWLVFHKRILTIDNLKKKGFYIPNRCVLCKKEEESPNHIFITCTFSNQVWGRLKCFVKLEGSAVVSLDISERIRLWSRSNPVNPAQWCSRVVLHAFCWCVWLERNNRIFNDQESHVAALVMKIGYTIFWWLMAARKVDKEIAEAWIKEMKNRLFPHNPQQQTSNSHSQPREEES